MEAAFSGGKGISGGAPEGHGQRFGQGSIGNRNAISEIASKSAYNCPEKNGRFPTAQCDAYIECIDGVGEERLCPDGLLFNAALGPHAFPCQYPIDVDCVGRTTTRKYINLYIRLEE
ncbi:Chitin binding Peritrophin-A domain [Popillia japonica]|uniref:Chitin binding Peritrophin-A domain n=1 Tax=Popillia japonica TaxID=7064 RepID=A0AAW1L4K1_POPJA